MPVLASLRTTKWMLSSNIDGLTHTPRKAVHHAVHNSGDADSHLNTLMSEVSEQLYLGSCTNPTIDLPIQLIIFFTWPPLDRQAP